MLQLRHERRVLPCRARWSALLTLLCASYWGPSHYHWKSGLCFALYPLLCHMQTRCFLDSGPLHPECVATNPRRLNTSRICITLPWGIQLALHTQGLHLSHMFSGTTPEAISARGLCRHFHILEPTVLLTSSPISSSRDILILDGLKVLV